MKLIHKEKKEKRQKYSIKQEQYFYSLEIDEKHKSRASHVPEYTVK